MSWTEFTTWMARFLGDVVHIFIVFVVPVLIIFGILKAVMDVFKRD